MLQCEIFIKPSGYPPTQSMTGNLIILTHPPGFLFKGFVSYWLKRFARKLLGRIRGPEGVLRSLTRGLDELSQPFFINKKPEKGDTVHVLSNTEALRYAIREKGAGRIGKLIAGPNLVVMPGDHDMILAAPVIDRILIVSPWVRDIYQYMLPEVIKKSAIWPAGVQIPNEFHDKRHSPEKDGLSCILFIKNAPAEIVNDVKKTLHSHNISVTPFIYGTFKQQRYFDALLRVDFMVYLQESESQGIALQEAWARDIPTLVWNKGSYAFPTGQGSSHAVVGNVAAPFMTDEAGMLFEKDFGTALSAFIGKMRSETPFAPRQYCETHLSDKASAQTYLNIISS